MVVDIINNLFSAISSYFTSLSHFGYKKKSDVNNLLIYSFIEEMLTGRMREFITEDDYRYIEKALHCLYGSTCFIPYPEYVGNSEITFTDGILTAYKKCNKT